MVKKCAFEHFEKSNRPESCFCFPYAKTDEAGRHALTSMLVDRQAKRVSDVVCKSPHLHTQQYECHQALLLCVEMGASKLLCVRENWTKRRHVFFSFLEKKTVELGEEVLSDL